MVEATLLLQSADLRDAVLLGLYLANQQRTPHEHPAVS
jgi:hypothetical protein